MKERTDVTVILECPTLSHAGCSRFDDGRTPAWLIESNRSIQCHAAPASLEPV